MAVFLKQAFITTICLLFGGNLTAQNDGPSKTGQSVLRFSRLLRGNDVPMCCISVSSDGTQLAYGQNGNVFVRGLSTGQVRQITHYDADDRATGTPVWSADDRQLAYWAQPSNQIVIVSVDGTATHSIYRNVEKNAVWPKAWSPDGKRLLAEAEATKQESRGLIWITVSTGSVQRISTRFVTEGAVALSPDGRYIAILGRTSNTTSQSPPDVHLVASDGSGEEVISSGFFDEPVGWTSDGRYVLIFRYPSLWAIPIRSGQASGPPEIVERDLAVGRNFSPATNGIPLSPLGVTHTGTFFYRNTTSSSDIYTASMDPSTGKITSAPTRLPLSNPGFNALPRWSPDGRQLLYHPVEWISENAIYSFDTGKEHRLAPYMPGGGICWTADGKSIISNPEIQNKGENGWPLPQPKLLRGIRRFDLSTTTYTQLLEPGDSFSATSCAENLLTSFSPSGIRVKTIQTGKETEIYHFSRPSMYTAPILSRDGRNVAFVGRSETGWALLVVPSTGGPARELVKLSTPAEIQHVYWGLSWSPDNRFVYFVRKGTREEPDELLRVPATGGVAESAGLRSFNIRDIDISPDATRIAFSSSLREVYESEVWAMENFRVTSK